LSFGVEVCGLRVIPCRHHKPAQLDQTALDHNRDWLSERGYLYPKLRDYAGDHNKLAHRLARGEQAKLNLRSKLNATVGDTLILSAEEFWAVTSRHEDWEEFCREDYWQRRIERLERLRTALRDFEDTVILLCFRRQDEFAASLYATKILSGRFRILCRFRSRRPLFDCGARYVPCRVRPVDTYLSMPSRVTSCLLLRLSGIPILPERPAERRAVTQTRLVQDLSTSNNPDPNG
jgi:hypothetical protein